MGPFLRDLEGRLHGRSHLQCVSVFGPELVAHPSLTEPIFRHPALDFASSHFYEHGTIDDPRNTVAPALSTGRLVREALGANHADRGETYDPTGASVIAQASTGLDWRT